MAGACALKGARVFWLLFVAWAGAAQRLPDAGRCARPIVCLTISLCLPLRAAGSPAGA